MKSKKEIPIKISFPVGLYFQQLFSADIYVKFINPFNFWRRYRIDHLENCRAIDIVRHLECCRQIEWQPTQVPQEPVKTLKAIGSYRGLPWEKTPQNTILMSQPSFELKYHGVTYRTSSVAPTKAHKLEINQPLLSSQNNSEEHPTSHDQPNLEASGNISQLM